ncbi:hypothetical protein [Nocardioides sp. B-3]|uniref:hypothetical protein n=1 Tax=Nocardioides sp. B-3 TaxID=2895565 RepID=UPI0021523231|nr:hypothetical protein [Nocardioides sp. B-3]UUZ59417.1 hypothetical protein LP418_27070 [Nocardioides sp. B-3]
MTTGQTTNSTDPRAMARVVVDQLTGPGGPFELSEEEVLGTRLPVFTHRRRAARAAGRVSGARRPRLHRHRDVPADLPRARRPGGVAGAGAA